ncbi:UNVERIFIED_CONTAM: DDE-type integrase/transposase/recombinase, partial [Salmonella enterica subsp. enterica serovar Weltevreden]
HCSAYCENKSHKLPFSGSTLSSSYPLEIIFSDVWTSSAMSSEGYKYYVIFVDHYTRYVWFYPLTRKSDVQSTLISYKALVEKFFDKQIKILYSDNGG